MFSGKDDCGKTGEAGGSGVAEEGFAGLGVILAVVELVHGGGGSDEEVESFEERGHLGTEFFEALAEGFELREGECGSPGEALRDDWLEVLEVAAVDDGGFAGLDAAVDFGAVEPEGGVKGRQSCSVSDEVLLPCFVGGEGGGGAVVNEVVTCVADADFCGHGNTGDVKDGVGEGGGVSQIAEDQADGVEGRGKVVGAGPSFFAAADTDGGAIADQATERGGNADRAACVSANGCDGGAFLNAGCSPAGGSSGEQACVAGLEAVAVVGVFAGDPVGELVEVSFAGEDCPGIEEALRDPGVFCRGRIVLGVEAGGAGGDAAGDVEAVFDGDGDAVEGWAVFGSGKRLGSCSAR